MNINCRSCGRITEAETYIGDGYLGKCCTLAATTVLKVFVIDGNVYVEHLKKSAPIAVSAAPARRKKVAS